MTDLRIRRVLHAYQGLGEPLEIQPAGPGLGFSGAEVWRVRIGGALWALRAWPAEHPAPRRLAWIHGVLTHVARATGSSLPPVPVPLPLATADRQTFVELGGRCWELAPWLPGEADLQSPVRHERLVAACRMLARFHRAAATYSVPCPDFESALGCGLSPGINERQEQLARWRRDDWRTLAAVLRTSADDWPALRQLAVEWLDLARRAAPRVADELSAAAGRMTPLQPCLRDVKRDHLLFTGDEVSGIIDFGALRPESVAADLARLLGSFSEGSTIDWTGAVAAYETIRPLTAYERELIGVFDDSGLVLAGANWIDWVWLQGRRFADRGAVEARLAAIVSRLASRAQRR